MYSEDGKLTSECKEELSAPMSITSKFFLSFMLMLEKNPFRTIHKHPFALSVQKIIRNKQKMWKLWISVLSYSMKSFTTPLEPVTLFSGFMLMLAKNPFGTIHKHPFALSVQKIITNRQKMWKLWISVLSSA